MILMPIVYVSDMDEAVAFYERLGFAPAKRSAMWSELKAGGGAILALHKTVEGAPPGHVELALVADEPLERVAERVPVARDIADEAFGRSLVVQARDGLRIQVNEHNDSPTS